MATFTKHYGSAAELIEAGSAAHADGLALPWVSDPAKHRCYIGREFSGWAGMAEAASGVWEDGQRVLAEMTAALGQVELPAPVSTRRRPVWDADGGDELDNDRLRSGQDYWRRTARQSGHAPQRVALVVNMSASGGTDPLDILWRGAAAAVLADLLEGAGYRVEVFATSTESNTWHDGKPDLFVSVRLKEAHQPLDVATLLNGVSGWFYRTAVMQSYCARGTVPPPALGMPRLLTDAQAAELTDADAVLRVEGVLSKDAAAELIRRVVAELNGGAPEGE